MCSFARSTASVDTTWLDDHVVPEPDAEIQLIVDGHRIPVTAALANDDQSIERTSRQLERKYAGDPELPPMLDPQVLPTTLRLEPATAD